MFRQRAIQIAQVSMVAAFSLSLVFATGCSRDPNVRKQKYLESGERYEAIGKYPEAVLQFTNALKVDKDFGDAYYERGKTYLKLGNARNAFYDLSRAVELSKGTNLDAQIQVGNLLFLGSGPATTQPAKDLLRRAEEDARAVLNIDPNYADAYALLAGVDQKKGDNAAAIQDIQRAISINPNRASYHTAAAELETGNPASEPNAEAELRKASSLDPKSASPHLVLAGLLEKKGDVAGAEQQYVTAVQIAPKNIQVRAALAGLYLRAGNKDKAEQTLRQAVDDLPDSEDSSRMLLEYYVRTGQADRAEPVFADLTAKHPKSFFIKLTYTRVLASKKEWDKATKVANELTKTDVGNPQVQVLNAMLLMNTNKVNDAFALLQKATKDHPENLELQMLLASVAELKGDATVSEASYRAAEKLSPGNLDALKGLAQIALRHGSGGVDELSDLADTTIRAHPDALEGYMWRATVEATRREYDKAEADYQTVLKKSAGDSPDNIKATSTALLELARIRMSQGHVPEGKAMLEKAVEKDPNAVQALSILMLFDMQAKQPAKAVARAQAAIQRSPTNGILYDELGEVQWSMGDFKAALESSTKAMQLAPNYPDAVKTYTKAEIGLGNIDPAISTWQQWIGAHPADANGFATLGTLEEAKSESKGDASDSAKAMDYYKKALQIDSNNAIAANNLAYMMVEAGQNMDVALTLAQTARRGMPDSPQTADTLAWIYCNKGDYNSARDLLEQALKAYPNDASMQFHLGMTYSKMNDKADALVHLKKSLAIAPKGKLAKEASDELAKLG